MIPGENIPVDASVVSIPLTQGKVAIVDAVDLPLLDGRRWYAVTHHGLWYAVSKLGKSDGFQSTRAHDGRQLLFMHRVVLNAPPRTHVDHVNGNGLDNRRSNLRLATTSQNNANSGPRRTNRSGFKGVYWAARQRRWTAQITNGAGSVRWLGEFASAEEAARAYDAAAREQFGEFAHCNFPD